jgi:AcrR family transcriptional regulator
MSAIAADLGGSKTTLWSYFPNKQDLFAAVIDDMVDRYGEALRLELPVDADVAEVLSTMGISILHTITKPQIISLHRLVVGEAGRSSALGRMLWERGAGPGHERTANWLALQMERGTLGKADPAAAASHFVGLCQAGSFQRYLLGAIARPSPECLAADVALAVKAFMRAYAP